MASFTLMILTLAWAATPPSVTFVEFNTEEACHLAAEALNTAQQPVMGLCMADPITLDGDPA